LINSRGAGLSLIRPPPIPDAGEGAGIHSAAKTYEDGRARGRFEGIGDAHEMLLCVKKYDISMQDTLNIRKGEMI
jgi:hypothetical protein